MRRATTIPIVRTKLYRPMVPDDVVCRKPLHRRLDTGAKLPLTLVSAPAGYGKSTVVSHWLETGGVRSAWLSLDESDNDLRVFLSYVVAAVQSASPKACSGMDALLSMPEIPPVEQLAGKLTNELDAMQEPFVLVLDDYNQIHKNEIHELLAYVLEHPPRGFNLVVISRRDPPLPLASFRAGRLLTEVRSADLKFTSKDTAAFLRQATGRSLEHSLVARMQDRMEGWPVGLRLAAVAMAGCDDLSGFMANLDDGLGSAQDYLVGEVLARLTPQERECVCRAAILDRFCAPLCQALCGHKCGKGCARERKTASIPAHTGVLAISLDDQGVWYRYHHLFQALLRRQLDSQIGADGIAELRLRAARWLETNGLLDEAIQQALAAARPDEAAGVILRQRDSILNQEKWGLLGTCLSRLPVSVVERNAELLLMKAWYLQSRGGWEESFEALALIEELLAQAPVDSQLSEYFMGSLEVLRAYRWFFGAEGTKALQCAEKALNILPERCCLELGEALIALVSANQMVGRLSRGRKIAMKHLSRFTDAQGQSFLSRTLAALCFADWVNADLPSLRREATRILTLGTEQGLPETLLVARYFLGIASYLSDGLDEAEKMLVAVTAGGSAGNAEYFAQSAFALAALREDMGDSDAAVSLVERMLAFGLDAGNADVVQSAEAFGADLAWRQGRLTEAETWAAEYNPEPLLPLYRFHAPPLTLAKIQLARGDAAGLRKAGLLLTRLQGFLERTHNVRFLMDVFVLQALLHERKGTEAEAIKCLDKAVELARPGGVVRAFAGLGPRLAPLLSRLELDEDGVRFVGRILAAMQVGTGASSGVPKGVAVRTGLVEPLSARELEILPLLADRMTNKEIGAKLFISPGTVKRHSENIYQKLSVHGRRAAVAKAQGLGLLGGD